MAAMQSTGITFGPVPSRRLGRSLGINNIPPKVCSYSCVYCQVGKTLQMETEPRDFYRPEEIQMEVKARLEALYAKGETVDYLTIVPDGEPTLDRNLGQTIELLRPLGIKIAVISNGSLLWQPKVRQALQKADWVSVKIDTTDTRTWRRINRPHPDLRLAQVLKGIRIFAEEYAGVLTTETMQVKNINDTEENILGVRNFVASMTPFKAYLAIPTRPCAEKGICPPAEGQITSAYYLFKEKISEVECLIEYEGDNFSTTGDIVEDLVNITSVHPMREEAVKKLLSKAEADWSVVDRLVKKGELVITEYLGDRFYVRRFRRTS